MASSMMVSTASVARASPAQTNMVAPFNGLRSSAAFPVTRKASDLSTLPSNGGRVRCMQVWPPEGKKKFETLSYLPDLSVEALAKEVEYLIRNGWIPCIEFSADGFVSRLYHASPGYYDGRYWTMWKLPMFGCTVASQVIAEVEEAKKAYPNYFIRIIGFDNKRQVQCISFIAYKPPATKQPVQLGAIAPPSELSINFLCAPPSCSSFFSPYRTDFRRKTTMNYWNLSSSVDEEI